MKHIVMFPFLFKQDWLMYEYDKTHVFYWTPNVPMFSWVDAPNACLGSQTKAMPNHVKSNSVHLNHVKSNGVIKNPHKYKSLNPSIMGYRQQYS